MSANIRDASPVTFSGTSKTTPTKQVDYSSNYRLPSTASIELSAAVYTVGHLDRLFRRTSYDVELPMILSNWHLIALNDKPQNAVSPSILARNMNGLRVLHDENVGANSI